MFSGGYWSRQGVIPSVRVPHRSPLAQTSSPVPSAFSLHIPPIPMSVYARDACSLFYCKKCARIWAL